MKALKHDSGEEDIDDAYLANMIVIAIKRSDQFQIKKSIGKKGSNAKVCYKCGIPKHLIKDYPMQKFNYQEYLKTGSDKGKSGEKVPEIQKEKL